MKKSCIHDDFMQDTDSDDGIERIVRECIAAGRQPRPEQERVVWFYERQRERYGISKKDDMDHLIAEIMYPGPVSKSAALKIRYWRTGRHVPGSREQVRLFGNALELNEEEMHWLLQSWVDRSDLVFSEEDTWQPAYQMRKLRFDEFLSEYLDKIHPDQKLRAKVPAGDPMPYLRHLYFLDALDYTDCGKRLSSPGAHSISANYDAEFRRQRMLYGEIPRTVMIRHLIILGAPFLNEEILSERLETMGYLPLTETHTGTGGERLDQLIIRFMKRYQEVCTGKDIAESTRWLKRACRSMDRMLAREGIHPLRFMYFKALGRNVENAHGTTL